jgi:hypothetical protein
MVCNLLVNDTILITEIVYCRPNVCEVRDKDRSFILFYLHRFFYRTDHVASKEMDDDND